MFITFPMKKHSILLTMTVAAAVLSAPAPIKSDNILILPENNSKIILHTIDMPVVDEDASIWDFSNSAYSSKDITIRFRNWGDSVISAILPGIRHDFRVSGDTVFITGSESRFAKINNYGAIERLISGSNERRQFDISGRVFSSDSLYGIGSSFRLRRRRPTCIGKRF